MAHLVLHIAAEAAGIAVLDELDLRAWHAEQRHEGGLAHEPVDEARPHLPLDHFPGGALLIERGGIEQSEGIVSDVWLQAEECLAHHPGGEAGGAVVEEGFLHAAGIEEGDALVPKLAGGFT